MDPATWLLTLLASHRMARIALDIFGGFLSSGVGQILVFIPFFAMAWGWPLRRLDCWGKGADHIG